MQRRGVLLGALIIALGGCTEITVHDALGVHTEYYPGLAVIHVERNPNTGTVVDVRGAGVLLGETSLIFGWQQQQTVTLPDPTTCRVVLLGDSDKAIAERLQRGIPDGKGICVDDKQ